MSPADLGDGTGQSSAIKGSHNGLIISRALVWFKVEVFTLALLPMTKISPLDLRLNLYIFTYTLYTKKVHKGV